MLNCEEVHSDFSGIVNNYLDLLDDKIIINADIKNDLNYTVIIQSLEEISRKLDYIYFDW